MQPIQPLPHRWPDIRYLLFCGALLMAPSAFGVNWVMLQGTEPDTAPAIKPFGFIGIDYQSTAGSTIPAGPWKNQPLIMNEIGPQFEDSDAVQVSHLRLGLRGRLLDGKLNYWVSPLAGYNPISSQGTPNVKFTEVSLTFNLIPHARVRVGQFMYAGSEEGLTPVVQRDYINVSQVSQQITNETYFDSDGAPMNDANDPTGPTSGWRDTGIQLFDSFKTGDWEHTYALMAGTGTGLAIYNGMGTGRPDWHLYWSSEWVFGGMGHTREGWKLTGWYQDGNREIRVGTAQREETFDRTRYGIGTTFRKGPWRAEAEWIGAEGMIYNGTDSMAIPGSIGKMGNKTVIASYNVLPDDEADGWYLDGGYSFLDKWEARIRYDRLNRGTASAEAERRFDTLTLGLTWRVHKQVRVMVDYQFRDVDAPRLASNDLPNQILEEVDDLLAARVWITF